MTATAIFHLSLHVHDLAAAQNFYGELLGCALGRQTDTWADYDFFGHQLSLHKGTPTATSDTGEVDGVAVPMPHFGAVLPRALWRKVSARLQQNGARFVLEPHTRYAGEPGEQDTLFVLDPSGNAIELKSMLEDRELFVGSVSGAG